MTATLQKECTATDLADLLKTIKLRIADALEISDDKYRGRRVRFIGTEIPENLRDKACQAYKGHNIIQEFMLLDALETGRDKIVNANFNGHMFEFGTYETEIKNGVKKFEDRTWYKSPQCNISLTEARLSPGSYILNINMGEHNQSFLIGNKCTILNEGNGNAGNMINEAYILLLDLESLLP